MEFKKLYDDLQMETVRKSGACLSKNSIDYPDKKRIRSIMRDIAVFVFPEYFETHCYEQFEKRMVNFKQIFYEQILAGICFSCTNMTCKDCDHCRDKAMIFTEKFIALLPAIKKTLWTDAEACYLGDPAATSIDEVIFTYPSITSMLHHRVAHELFKMGVKIIPRFIAELSHAKTGIDIHPGATIACGFFMDHGTGIVIGETAVIGNNVKIYQGVTLGAKSFPLDEDGIPIKGAIRHPIVEDNVTIYSGATILGRITIGTGAVIGGNVWVTEDVSEGIMVTQK